MNDEQDVAVPSLQSASGTNDFIFNEGNQRQLDLQPIPPPVTPTNIPNYADDKYIAYTIKLPAHQLAALQSIWLELKRLYGAHSPDKSGMIQDAVEEWLKRWDGPDRAELLDSLLQIRADTRRRQYKK